MLPLSVLCVLVAAGPGAEAPEQPEYETVVKDEKAEDGASAQRRIDAKTPGFATAIDLSQEAGARPADALPEVIAHAPAATVRSIGGLGQYSSVSIRGSSGQQVALFLDGVPIDSGTAGLVSLSDQPLDALDRIEIYRGHIPVTFGSATIGGAINLVGKIYRGPRRGTFATGIGSFGAREARLSYGQPIGDDQSINVRLGYAGATGDFRFFDHHGTLEYTGDDTFETRTNNGYDRLFANARLDGRRGNWLLSTQVLGLHKHQGIPGPRGAQTTTTFLDTADLRLIQSVRRIGLGAGGSFGVVGSVDLARLHYVDREPYAGGIGTSDQTTAGTDLFLSPRLRLPLWPSAFVTATADVRTEHRGTRNASGGGAANRERTSFGAGIQLEQFLFGSRLLLAPVFRADLTDSRFAVPAGAGEFGDTGEDHTLLAFSPRGGARLEICDWLELRGSVGRYFRPPNVLELFGNRGYFVGNEGLRPESGTAFDAGIVFDSGPGPFAAYLQAAGFGTLSEDTIIWDLSTTAVRPTNLPEGALVAGFESQLIANAFGDSLRAQASYTYAHSRDRRGAGSSQHDQPLPGRPEHELYMRASAGAAAEIGALHVSARIFYTIDFIARSLLDPSGNRPESERGIHGAGVEVTLLRRGPWPLEARLAGEVRNLLDHMVTTWTHPDFDTGPLPVPVSDFIGYPLPGRSFWLTLSISAPSQQPQEKL